MWVVFASLGWFAVLDSELRLDALAPPLDSWGRIVYRLRFAANATQLNYYSQRSEFPVGVQGIISHLKFIDDPPLGAAPTNDVFPSSAPLPPRTATLGLPPAERKREVEKEKFSFSAVGITRAAVGVAHSFSGYLKILGSTSEESLSSGTCQLFFPSACLVSFVLSAGTWGAWSRLRSRWGRSAAAPWGDESAPRVAQDNIRIR